MLSRRGVYTTAKGTLLRRFCSMGPYNIELKSIKSALKTPDLKKSHEMLWRHSATAAATAAAARGPTIASNKMPIQSIYLEDFDGPWVQYYRFWLYYKL